MCHYNQHHHEAVDTTSSYPICFLYVLLFFRISYVLLGQANTRVKMRVIKILQLFILYGAPEF